jgi:hypothetical protein
MDADGALRLLAPGLWVADRPLRLVVGDIGARMTVLRLHDGGLVLHSPVRLDAATRRALDELGPVHAVNAPSKPHNLFAGDYTAAYPDATRLRRRVSPASRRRRRRDQPPKQHRDQDFEGFELHELLERARVAAHGCRWKRAARTKAAVSAAGLPGFGAPAETLTAAPRRLSHSVSDKQRRLAFFTENH